MRNESSFLMENMVRTTRMGDPEGVNKEAKKK